MKKMILSTILLFQSVYSSETSLPLLPDNLLCVEWHSPEGMNRLQSSMAKENFWKLVRYYESQIRMTYCGVAASVMALNALSVEAPASKFLGQYRMFTQEEFFSEQVKAVIDEAEVARRGLSLGELANVLQTFPIRVSKYAAQSHSHEEIREVLIAALHDPKKCVLGLYQRRNLRQVGGGHWSPIAAYDSDSDSFLILDVARFKYPPVWIDAFALIDAMQTWDITGDHSRGFIVIEKD